MKGFLVGVLLAVCLLAAKNTCTCGPSCKCDKTDCLCTKGK